MNVAAGAEPSNVRRPPRAALAPSRPARADAPAATPTPQPGPASGSTNCEPPRQAHRFARRLEHLSDLAGRDFQKNGRVSG